MKMTSIIFLYCFYFLVCDINTATVNPTLVLTTSNQTSNSSTIPPQPNMMTILANNVILHTNVPVTKQPKSTSCSSPTSPPSTIFNFMKKEHLLMVSGGLILACTVLLCSTLLLAWKVCQLSRRFKMLHSHSDLISPTKYRMESTEKKENKSETDANETTVLMSDLNQTCDESGDGGKESNTENNKKGEEKVCENGVEQKGNGAKNEEPKETPAAVTENVSSPQEEGANSQTSKPEEAATTKDKKEANGAE